MACVAPQLYKTNAKPAWWPHATFSTEQLKTRASLDAIYNALRSRFGRMVSAVHELCLPRPHSYTRTE